MKRILCIGLICITLLGLCSCSLWNEITDPIAGGTGIHLHAAKLQDLFSQGLDGLRDAFGQNVIQATAEALNNEAGILHVYDDKLVLTVSTDAVRDKVRQSGVSLESIKEERRHADMSHVEYVLQYQYCVSLSINQKQMTAVCYADVLEDALNNTVDITIPISAENVGITVYELLQGKELSIESCLKHGIDTTEIAQEQYYLNKAPEGAKTLTMQDHRENTESNAP